MSTDQAPTFGWSLDQPYDAAAARSDATRTSTQLRRMTDAGLGSADLPEALVLIAVLHAIVARVGRHEGVVTP